MNCSESKKTMYRCNRSESKKKCTDIIVLKLKNPMYRCNCSESKKTCTDVIVLKFKKKKKH